MLTDNEIQDAITKGDIKIEPFDSNQIKPGNYKVKLGHKLLIPKKGLRVNPFNNSQVLYDEYDISDKSYILKPKEFILAQTFEKIGLSKDIAAILDGRSTLARLGLSIHQSAQLIVAGEKPQIITLEIYNAGEFEIELINNWQVGKLIFYRFSRENTSRFDDFGKYSGQEETTAPILP
ncbi:MAG: dCTP deaminase [bacterium]